MLQKYRSVLPAQEFAALNAWASTFYPFQREWLFEPADYALCNKSRQIGLSHTTSGLGVLWGAFHGELTTIISIGELESTEVLDKAKRHAIVLSKLGSRMAQPVRDNAKELVFASGGRILALPSTGGRSFTGNVFLDEFAYQEHAGAVWDAAAAVTMLGGRMRVASTPNGVGNDFANLWKKAADPAFGWARHEIPIQRAIDDGYPVDVQKCWALAKGDPRLFDQLFNCKFLDGEAQYIPTHAIEACSEDVTIIPGGGECYAGLDIGRTSDRTELVIVRKMDDGVRWHQYGEGRKRTSWDDVETLARMAFAHPWNCRRLCVDSSGLGAFPAEELQRKFGRSRIEPVTFTQQVKEDLATSMYTAFVEGTIRIPRSDTMLRDDLCAIRRIITTAGNVRYDAPHTEEGHADKAWALALALHGCNSPANYRQVLSGR